VGLKMVDDDTERDRSKSAMRTHDISRLWSETSSQKRIGKTVAPRLSLWYNRGFEVWQPTARDNNDIRQSHLSFISTDNIARGLCPPKAHGHKNS
jgi:hypothetical protein